MYVIIFKLISTKKKKKKKKQCKKSVDPDEAAGNLPCHQYLHCLLLFCFFVVFIIPRHTIVAGYYGFTLVVRVSVRPSVRRTSVRVSFPDDNLVNINGFSPNSVCALILWRSGLGLLMGKFRQFLTELSARDMPIFSFPDNNLRI